jgi:hypothetical protein
MPDDTKTFGWAAADQNLVTPHMEYMRKNRWILEFTLPAGLAAAMNNPAASLRLNCSKAARPNISFEDTEVKRLNGSIYLPGKPKYEPLQVSFYDSIQMRSAGGADASQGLDTSMPSTSDVMEGWRELMYQPNKGDAFGSAANCKGLAYLHMLEPMLLESYNEDGDVDFAAENAGQGITQTWLIQGIFPQKIEYGDLDYGSSDVQEISVSFRYDRAFRIRRKEAITN